MNAKKIMGAVLVALLAAALFIGAGAAEGTNYGSVYTYQAVSGIPAGIWEAGDASVEITSTNFVIPSANFVSGAVYKKGDDSLTVYYPTVAYSANGSVNTIGYIVQNNGIAYNGSTLTVTATPYNNTGITAPDLQISYPNGSVITGANPFSSGAELSQKGVYKIQAVFNKSNFMNGDAPFDLMLDSKVFTFTVVGDEDATIVADKDTAYNGAAVTLTVTGTPGAKYNLSIKGLDLNTGLYSFDKPAPGIFNITLENNGKAVLTGLVNKSSAEEQKTVVIKLIKADGTAVENGEVKVKIAAPVVTAKTEKNTYYLGDKVKITGTSTSNVELNFSIKGTNFPLTYFKLDKYVAGTTWEGELDTAKLQENTGEMLDVGVYSIIIKQGGEEVATLPVSLIQPFIQLTSAPEVVVQGTKATFVGTAEATNQVFYYVFGTNFFDAKLVDSQDFNKNEFTFEISGEKTKNMSAGQYFVVVQHPMYDKVFNIAPNYSGTNLTGAIVLEATGTAVNVVATEENTLFNVSKRQTANAAQALCDALDNQEIDDMYVKYAFIIAGKDQAFSINEIPSEIAKGETLTISGTSTASEGKYVTVELISTAFAAVPKETVGSASFIALSTQVAEDGTWEVTFDTSNINVDEYSLKVACDDETWKSTTINVVEADEPVNPEQPEEPEQPEQPEEPVAPATPGFGALAALAGLGAVAVLLLRRE